MESVSEMIPSLFFILCITVSGGDENCDYQWDVINDAEKWAALHNIYDVGGTPGTTNGFTVLSEKRIFVLSDAHTLQTISHEVEHVICHVEQPLDQRCHTAVDTNTPKDIPVKEPPQRTAKFKDSLYGRVNELGLQDIPV